MLGFNHVLAGSLIGVLTPLPLSPAVALASHFVLDALPHYGEDPSRPPYSKRFYRLLLYDALLCFSALGIALFLFPEHAVAILLSVVLATLPDFLWPLWDKVKWMHPFFRFHKNIQWAEKAENWPLEIIYALIGITLLLILTLQ